MQDEGSPPEMPRSSKPAVVDYRGISVKIEYHVGKEADSMSTRYKPEKYVEQFDALKSAIQTAFPGFDDIQANPAPNPLYFKPYKPPSHLKQKGYECFYTDRFTKQRIRIPRLGAFEVSVVLPGFEKEVLVHSKLQSKAFPKQEDIIAAMMALRGF